MQNPLETYEMRLKDFSQLLGIQNHEIHRIGLLRLWLFGISLLVTIGLYVTHHSLLSFVYLGVAVIVFAILVLKSSALEKKRNLTEQLCNINEASINRLQGKWKQFEDTGVDFVDYEHPFSQDLDLFGQGSLYQWTNVARTFLGRKRFCISKIIRN